MFHTTTLPERNAEASNYRLVTFGVTRYACRDMAKLPVDWELAKALIHQGIPQTEVAKRLSIKYGTLRQHLRRNGVYAVQKRVVAMLPPKDEELPSMRPELKRKLAVLVKALPDHPPSPKSLKSLAETTHTITQSAKILEGWEDSTTVHFDLTLLSSPVITSRPESPQVPAVTTDSTITDAEVVHDSNVNQSQIVQPPE